MILRRGFRHFITLRSKHTCHGCVRNERQIPYSILYNIIFGSKCERIHINSLSVMFGRCGYLARIFFFHWIHTSKLNSIVTYLPTFSLENQYLWLLGFIRYSWNENRAELTTKRFLCTTQAKPSHHGNIPTGKRITTSIWLDTRKTRRARWIRT